MSTEDEEAPAIRSMLDEARRLPSPPLTVQQASELAVAASAFLGALQGDEVVQRVLGQLARDSINDALREIAGGPYVVHGGKDYKVVSKGESRIVSPEATKARYELVHELEAAAVVFRARGASELAAQVPYAAKAAKKIRKHSDLGVAAARIAQAARKTLSSLPPYWLLVILWWLIVYGSSKQIEALSLMYMVLSETMKKKD